MSSSDFIFTSYCFNNKASGDYVSQQVRLIHSIKEIYPDANFHMFNEPEEIGKPKFQQSLYGFKVHLVNDCLKKGFKKIIFFDAAITLVDKVDHWFEIAETFGVLAPIDRQTLENVTSDNCLKWLGWKREDLTRMHLCGGSIYIFDFETELCKKIFDKWQEMEAAGLFGTQDDLSNDRLQGHRMDETCMALSLYINGSTPLPHDLLRYSFQHPDTKQITGTLNPIVLKKHFK